MKAFNITVVHESAPMIVAKAQTEMIERMDPGFWDTKHFRIFEMLSKHELKPLGEYIAEMHQGDVPRKTHGERYEQAGIKFIRAENLLPTGLDLTNLTYISEAHYKRIERASPRDRNLLIGRHGVASTGRVAIFLSERIGGKCNISSHLNVIRLRPPANSFYLSVYLKSKFGQAQIERFESGVGSTGIRFDQIESLLTPVVEREIAQAVEANYLMMTKHHYSAIDAKAQMLQAQEDGNITVVEEYRGEYEHNMSIAKAMLNDLIRQIEEIIEGKRMEIEPVDRVLQESQR